jgi:hypothetical protein
MVGTLWPARLPKVKIMTLKSIAISLDLLSFPSDTLAPDSRLAEDGSLLPTLALPARKPRSSKQPADTVTGCRDRATADLLAAAAAGTRNGQLRMEVSSASWSARAALLQLDDSFEARMKVQQLMR